MEREEHLEWAKERALRLLDGGDTTGAFTSMESDLEKHDELRAHPGIQIGLMMLLGGHLDAPDKMRKFINGFR